MYSYIKQLNVEIAIFFIYASFLFEGSVSANFIMYRTCSVTLGINDTECAKLGTGNTDNTTIMLENIAQPYTAVILMVKLILEYVIPALTCFFLGPWTDKYGRKPVLLYATIGYGVAYIIMLTVSIIPNISPWYIMLAYVPICLTGGFPSLHSAMVCYIIDVAKERDKGFRLGLLDAFLNAGGLLGGMTTSFLFKAYGYFAVYCVCAFLCILAWVFILIFVPESVSNRVTKNKCSSLFEIAVLKDTLKSIFNARKLLGKPLIFICISMQVLFYLSYQSEFYVVFLFVREKFQWSLSRFTIYNAINNIVWIIGNLVGSYILHKLLGIQEIYIIMSGILCGVIGSTWQGLATESWHVYAGGWSKGLGGAVIPMSLSLLSNLVSLEESGKIMALVSAFKTFGVLAAAPLFTWVYNSTLAINPGIFNFVTVGIYVIGVLLCVMASVMLRNQGNLEKPVLVQY